MAAIKPLYFNTVEGIEQEINATTDTVAFAQVVLNGLSGVGINANGQAITGLPAPVNASDASTKAYVDAVVQGLDLKGACLIATTENITLSGTQTLQGVALAAGSRVLVSGQDNAVDNGIYVVADGAWARSEDLAAGAGAAAAYAFIEEGDNADSGWVCTSDPGSDAVGTAATSWTQFSRAADLQAGPGLQKQGNYFAVVAGQGISTDSGVSVRLDEGLAFGDSGAVKVNCDPYTLGINDDGALVTKGLPANFTIAMQRTADSVTADSLGALTSGAGSFADELHSHHNVQSAQACMDHHLCQTAVAAGDPVVWSATAGTLARADAASAPTSRVIGIAAAAGAAGATIPVIKRGVAAATFTGGTPGAPVFLNAGGGLSMTAPASGSLVRIGWLSSATDVDVAPVFLGQRSA